MNLGELLEYTDMFMFDSPKKISFQRRKIILNEAALEIASKLNLIRKSTTVAITAEDEDLVLSTIITDFLRMDDSPVYHNIGTDVSVYWDDLDPVTRDYLDRDFVNWRDESSGTPQRYYVESNLLVMHPKPDTSLTSGLKIYYIAKPTKMTESSHYPFGYTVEIPQYSVLSETILKYYEYKVLRLLGKFAEAAQAEALYVNDLMEKKKEFRTRLDINANDYTKYRGDKIR